LALSPVRCVSAGPASIRELIPWSRAVTTILGTASTTGLLRLTSSGSRRSSHNAVGAGLSSSIFTLDVRPDQDLHAILFGDGAGRAIAEHPIARRRDLKGLANIFCIIPSNAPSYPRLCHDIRAIISCNTFARRGRLFPRRFRIRTPACRRSRFLRYRVSTAARPALTQSSWSIPWLAEALADTLTPKWQRDQWHQHTCVMPWSMRRSSFTVFRIRAAT
jgi:hypothetical protein